MQRTRLSLSALLLVAAGASAAPPAPAARLGAPAPIFALPALNEEVALEASTRTQVGVTDFCGVRPTRPKSAVVIYFFSKERGGEQLATLSRMQRRMGGKGVQFIGVATDTGDLGPLSTWIEGQNISFPVVRDNHGVVAARYGISELPLTVVVEGGTHCAVHALGLAAGAELEPAIEASVAPLLGR